MPLEVKDIADVFGFDPSKMDSVKELKTWADETWTKTEEPNEKAKKKANNTLVAASFVALRRAMKGSGVELPESETSGMTIQEAVEYAVDKLNQKYSGEIDSLKKQTGEPDVELKKLTDKNKKLEVQLEEFKKAITEKDQMIEGERTKFASDFKNLKLDQKKSEYHGKIKFSNTSKELERRGFMSHLSESYTHDLDESGNLITMGKDGNRIKHDKKTGEFMSYGEIIERDMNEFEGLAEKNPHAESNPHQQRQASVNQNQNNQQANTNTFKPAPRIKSTTLVTK